jgi:signal transduction histidine kinase
VMITDDGVGLGSHSRGHGRGLTNLECRAASVGGVMRLLERDGGGLVLEWEIPVATKGALPDARD